MHTKTEKFARQRLKELRKKRCLTQEQLAELIGVGPKAISHYESGRSLPTKHLVEIAEALEVSVAELFEDDFETLSEHDLKERITKKVMKLDKVTLIKLCKIMQILDD